VGTGPYTYDYYITDTEVMFTKFEDYWATQAPYNLEDELMFDLMIYRVIDDRTALNYAMFTGDIDIVFNYYSSFLTDLLPAYRTNPWITVYEADKPGLVYQYLNFNTKLINVTWRKAMSYAINYTYIIEVMLEGRAFRAYGAISPIYGAGFNHWLRDAPGPDDNGSAVYDLSVARDALLNGMGADSRLAGLVSSDDPDDAAWEAVELNTFNYSYNTDNWFRYNLYIVLVDWFDDIGITLIDGGTDWGYFILRAWGYVPGGYDRLNMFFTMESSYPRWAHLPTSKNPEYLDPFNRLDPLFSNISVSNTCLINDPWVMGNLSLALQTIDDTVRNQIYRDIEWRLFAELYVHAPVNHNMITSVHGADLYDVCYNAMNRWWALPVKRNLTWVPEI
jgi:ABC-type transport system substrate-binding protein